MTYIRRSADVNPTPVPKLINLPDVAAFGLKNGDVLEWDESLRRWVAVPNGGGGGGGVENLYQLKDVALRSLRRNEFLVCSQTPGPGGAPGIWQNTLLFLGNSQNGSSLEDVEDTPDIYENYALLYRTTGRPGEPTLPYWHPGPIEFGVRGTPTTLRHLDFVNAEYPLTANDVLMYTETPTLRWANRKVLIGVVPYLEPPSTTLFGETNIGDVFLDNLADEDVLIYQSFSGGAAQKWTNARVGMRLMKDVLVSSPQAGHTLLLDTSVTPNVWRNGFHSLANLSDVDFGTPVAGATLLWAPFQGKFILFPMTLGTSYNTLDNVDNTPPNHGQVLLWNAGSSKWVPDDLPPAPVPQVLGTSGNTIGNVSNTDPAAGQYLSWTDVGRGSWILTDAPAPGKTKLSDLDDVLLTGPIPGEVLTRMPNNTWGNALPIARIQEVRSTTALVVAPPTSVTIEEDSILITPTVMGFAHLLGSSSVAIGAEVNLDQHDFSVNIGRGAGSTTPGSATVAIGARAGSFPSTNNGGVYIGYDNGRYQGANGGRNVSIGQHQAAIGGPGGGPQGIGAVGIGTDAGRGQGAGSVAVGMEAGIGQQGDCVAVGLRAGTRIDTGTGNHIPQPQGTICLGTDSYAPGSDVALAMTVNANAVDILPQDGNAVFLKLSLQRAGNVGTDIRMGLWAQGITTHAEGVAANVPPWTFVVMAQERRLTSNWTFTGVNNDVNVQTPIMFNSIGASNLQDGVDPSFTNRLKAPYKGWYDLEIQVAFSNVPSDTNYRAIGYQIDTPLGAAYARGAAVPLSTGTDPTFPGTFVQNGRRRLLLEQNQTIVFSVMSGYTGGVTTCLPNSTFASLILLGR